MLDGAVPLENRPIRLGSSRALGARVSVSVGNVRESKGARLDRAAS